jgi:hypothetical protein
MAGGNLKSELCVTIEPATRILAALRGILFGRGAPSLKACLHYFRLKVRTLPKYVKSMESPMSLRRGNQYSPR